MTPSQRWQQIEKLYHAALNLAPEAQGQLLSGADADVRHEVESLLRQDVSNSTNLMSEPLPLPLPTLGPGSQLGPYAIEGPIGAGGMGEVWKARDSRLNRTVAIKTCRAQYTDRFQREARAVAALSHPHIAMLYDVGASPEGMGYLVLEYVEGPTLADLLKKGALPQERALPIALQIAEAVEAAHERGIIHRDLKPANIKITPDGSVKVLDFGLAKALGDDAADRPEESTTMRTQLGMIMGTPAYMPPEQAAGRKTDRRADIWSFGTILYEMVSGRRPFTGETTTELLASVIKDAPQLDGLPLGWRELIERCLVKDVRHRLQSIGEARIALEGGLLVPVLPLTERTVPRARWPWVLGMLATAAAGFIAAALWQIPTGAEGDASPIATESTIQIQPSWSPAGDRIAYAADVDGVFQIFTKQLSSLALTQVTHEDSSSYGPFWSKDSTRIYFSKYQSGGLSTLWSVSIAGGQPEKVLDGVDAAAMAPDGSALAVLKRDETGLHRLAISKPIGAPPVPYTQKPVSELRIAGWLSALSYSPDGRNIALYTSASGRPEFWRVPVDGRAPEELSRGTAPGVTTSPFAWLPDGQVLMGGSPAQLWDPQSGTSRPVTSNVSNVVDLDVSPNGRDVIVARGQVGFDIIEIGLDGSPQRNVRATSQDEVAPSVAPGGGSFAFAATRGGMSEIRLRNRQDGSERVIVPGEKGINFLDCAISPDGSRIAYRRQSAGSGETSFDIWIAPLSGEAPVPMWRDPARRPQRGPSWSPDGNWIAYYSERDGKPAALKIQVGSNKPPQLVAYMRFLNPVRWSPAGNWIAYDDVDGLHVASPDGKQNRVLTSKRWLTYGWSKDGAALYGLVLTGTKHLTLGRIDAAAWRETEVADLGTRPASVEYDIAPKGNFGYRGFSLNADGKSFLTSVYRAELDLWLIRDFDQKISLLDWLLGRPRGGTKLTQ